MSNDQYWEITYTIKKTEILTAKSKSEAIKLATERAVLYEVEDDIEVMRIKGEKIEDED
jgi:hypothetical protein